MGLAQRIQGEGNKEDALQVFEWNTQWFPDYAVPFYNYGDILAELGSREEAITAYQTGLDNLKKNQNITEVQRPFFELTGNWGLKRLKNFNTSEQTDLSYYTYHGGGVAGSWDTENLIQFKNTHKIAHLRYKNFDIYNRPVPTEVSEIFSAKETPDVVAIFNGWTYLEQVDAGEIVSIDSIWKAGKLG